MEMAEFREKVAALGIVQVEVKVVGIEPGMNVLKLTRTEIMLAVNTLRMQADTSADLAFKFRNNPGIAKDFEAGAASLYRLANELVSQLANQG